MGLRILLLESASEFLVLLRRLTDAVRTDPIIPPTIIRVSLMISNKRDLMMLVNVHILTERMRATSNPNTPVVFDSSLLTFEVNAKG